MFNKLKAQVQARFAELTASGQTLFYINIDREEIFAQYLAGWADDPIEQQGHNCNCCKSFLRQYGGIVTIVDNKVQSIWDISPDDLYIQAVRNVRNYVTSRPISDVFVNPFPKIGTDKNVDSKDSKVVWNHFYLELPKQYVNKNSDAIPAWQSNLRDIRSVFKRSLDELTVDAVQTVLELIAQGSLYKGNESLGVLTEFQKLQHEYKNIPLELKDNYTWATAQKISPSLAKIRNTAIGTLLIDLSAGVDLDTAVASFERMVAPTNYKRPKALVTPKMVEEAQTKLTELGYLESLNRRFVQPTDLNINNMLYIDKSSTISNVFDDMKKDTQVNPRTLSKTEEIRIGDFISNVLPNTKALYILLENSHLNNMVTMVTSVNGAPTLFKWNNPFSWSYTGGITDSIKERVKQAGGNVDGELRVSLSWHNYDDLDLHVREASGAVIMFNTYKKPAIAPSSGQLDVDMNAGSGTSRNPVENIVWTDPSRMKEGRYRVVVHNFAQRERDNVGFEIQIECRGEVFELSFPNNPRDKEHQTIIEFDYSRTNGVKVVGDVKSNIMDKEKWNLKTNRFHKVKNMMLSPNFWDGEDKGNKHHFFILENCASDEQTRTFFNEFLKDELVVHKRFFEVLGSKLVIAPTTHQVAGLGFSDTQRNHVIVRVEGAFQRVLRVKF